MNIEAGQVIDGKYRVVKLLGQGGMGAVYLAEHMVIGRRVALKVLLGNVAGNETAVARFEREAQAAGRIGNDHILEIFDFGSLSDGSRYMVCEFLEGETLATRLSREGRLSPAALVPLARQLLGGLGAAHQAGVVHRGLEPVDIFILRQKAGLPDFVKIIDFGISKFQPLSTGEGMQMTATGMVVGTPCYLSPEQARGSREADARSDLYAVGVILYECVSGTLPFDAQNINDLLFKIVLENPRPLREVAPELAPGFAQIIEVAMSRDAEHRFQTAAAFSAALESWALGHGLLPAAGAGQLTPGAGVRAPSGNNPLASGSNRSLAPTPQTWADSQITAASFRQPKRRTGPVVGGSAATLLAAGAAFALFANGSGSGGSPTAASTGSPAPLPPVSSAPVPQVAPLTPPSTLDTVSPPAPEVTPPPATTQDARALLEPPSGSLPNPVRKNVGAKRSGDAAPKKTGNGEAPPAPPAPETKRHRDFGY